MISRDFQIDIHGLISMSNKFQMNEYFDPVRRRLDIDYSLSLKNNLTLLCDSDISDTRLARSFFSKFESRYEIHDNALLLPYLQNYHIPRTGIFEHWAYDKNLNAIHIADHYKPVLKGYADHSLLPVYPFRANLPKKSMKGKYYYMGMLNPHYGHFIQEAVTRYWLALKKPNLVDDNTKFVFHVFENFNIESVDYLYNSGLGEYLNILGVTRDKFVFIKEPTVFENIIIPESSISISDGNCYLSDEARNVWLHLNKMMARYENRKDIISNRKVYLTRKNVKRPIQGRVLVNEKELESFFVSCGFDIISPEEYSQQEIQKILSNTKTIAGNPGSGLQNSFFIPNSANTIGITCLPIIKINPGLNHQVNTDLICGHKTFAYCTSSKDIEQSDNYIHYRVNISHFEKCLDKYKDII